MFAFATDIINGSALWRIILVSLVGGAGVAIAFGLLLLGLERAQQASGRLSARLAGFGLVTVSGAFCLAAIVVGLIAMTHK